MIWSISLKIRTYLSCITIDIKQMVLSVHYPLPVFEKVSLYGHVSTFRYSGSGFMRFEPQGHLVTTVAASPGALSQLVAATDSVWPPQQLRRHVVLQVVCLWKWNEVNWRSVLHWLCWYVCSFIYLYMLLGVCLWLALVCMSVWVGVLMWWCSDVQDECGSLLCLSLHLWLWQSLHPPRSCCHMLPASVSAKQKA